MPDKVTSHRRVVTDETGKATEVETAVLAENIKNSGDLPEMEQVDNDGVALLAGVDGKLRRTTLGQLLQWFKAAIQAAISFHLPYADQETGHWMRYNPATGEYEDTGATAIGQDGQQGVDGKSPYTVAQENGYGGTEEEFNAVLAALGTAVSIQLGGTGADNADEARANLGAASKVSPEFSGSLSLNRNQESVIGNNSVATGTNTIASGDAAHAEGYQTKATGNWSHAEGFSTEASEKFAHAEGKQTKATGEGSHAEGSGTKAENWVAHAEGWGSVASGGASHAEGTSTVASGSEAHAEGKGTIAANNYSHAQGIYNKGMGSEDTFVIGNGVTSTSRSNAFRVTSSGTVYGTGQFQTSGADYAEFFEWLDANDQGEDRVGRFVTMEGDKIKLAQPGDYILGIVSGNPCIVGNADEDWLGRWEHDDFGRFVREYLEQAEREVQPPEGLDEEGIHRWMQANQVEARDGAYIQTVAVVVDHETSIWRYKANPDYDPTKPYIERKDRKEWDYVGMLGVLAVLDDGTCQINGFCQVAEGGTATAADGYIPGMTYRVIERVADNIVKVVFR